jgi:hypothetical protein
MSEQSFASMFQVCDVQYSIYARWFKMWFLTFHSWEGGGKRRPRRISQQKVGLEINMGGSNEVNITVTYKPGARQ